MLRCKRKRDWFLCAGIRPIRKHHFPQLSFHLFTKQNSVKWLFSFWKHFLKIFYISQPSQGRSHMSVYVNTQESWITWSRSALRKSLNGLLSRPRIYFLNGQRSGGKILPCRWQGVLRCWINIPQSHKISALDASYKNVKDRHRSCHPPEEVIAIIRSPVFLKSVSKSG